MRFEDIPPLRERDGDILLLANAFLVNTMAATNKKNLSFSSAAIRSMEAYSWPGNIREMENRVKRAVIMAESAKIQPRDLELDKNVKEIRTAKTLKEARAGVERELILGALDRHNGNLTLVAKDLDISRPSLYDLMKKLDITKMEA